MRRRLTVAGKPRLCYAERRAMLLIELRLMRRTHPARRVVKHQQRLMRSLRFAHREGLC